MAKGRRSIRKSAMTPPVKSNVHTIPTGDVKRESDSGTLHIHARGRSLSLFSILIWGNGVREPGRCDSDRKRSFYDNFSIR